MNQKLVQGLLLVCLLVAGTALAAGPNLLSYQGQVLTAGGAPVANGVYPAVFTFFPVSSGGTSLWTESASITTSAGLFAHTLGSVTPIPTSVFTTNPDVWLEVTVNGQLQTPRTQLTSVGNAITVSTLDGATGGAITQDVSISGSLGIGTTTPSSELEIVGDLTVSGDIIGSTPWTPFPYAAGYSDYVDAHGGGFQRAEYRKIGDVVYLRGVAHKVDHAPIPTAAVLGTLPAGFRPPAVLRFLTDPGYTDVHPSGAVLSTNGLGLTSDYHFLDGIFFSTSP